MSERNPNDDMNQLRDEVDALRRRVDEQAALLRRTHNAVASLAESLGKVVANQRRRDKWINLNSFVAYTLFTVLLGGGFFMLYDSRAGALLDAREVALEERDAARERVASLRLELEERAEAEKAAREYYTLLQEGRHAEAIAQYGDVETARLTPAERAFFTEGVKKARSAIVETGYRRGLEAYRAGRFGDAATELTTALTHVEDSLRAVQMRYYLGLSYFKAADYTQAAEQLQQAMNGQAEQAGIEDVGYYLATALERIGKFAEARAEYDKFANAHPMHAWAAAARRRSAQLARKGMITN